MALRKDVPRAKTLLFIFLIFIPSIESARILAVFPFPYFSHHTVHDSVIEALAKRGHEIFTITTSTKTHIKGNITEINTRENVLPIKENANISQHREEISNDPTVSIPVLLKMLTDMLEAQFSLRDVQDFLKTNCKNKFDVIIVESPGLAFYSLSEICNAPMIVFSTTMILDTMIAQTGTPTHPFLYPSVHSFNHNIRRANWFAKTRELYNTFKINLNFNEYTRANDLVVRNHYGPGVGMVDDVFKSDSIYLMNIDALFMGARPTSTQLTTIGNLHIKKKAALDRDLLEYLNNATEGVVYFSMGSTVLSSQMPEHIISIIKSALGELPYRIVWKWENDEMEDKPRNVYLAKWVAQQDLFGHPNLKVFVTQGGLQSVEEAIFNRVPMVGIPIFGDQDFNVRRLALLEIGRFLLPESLTKEALKHAVLEVAQNKLYKEKISRLSAAMHDLQMSPAARSVWWVEYVARHGTRALRAPAATVGLVEFLLLDVLAVLTLAFTVATFAIYYSIKRLYCLLLKMQALKIKC